MGVNALERFQRAISAIDAANAEDPNLESDGGESVPKELLYGRRMSAWLDRLDPGASEPLRLAARAQHLERWKIPRDSYPMDRAGYLKWRTTLYRFHADRAAEILRETGYEEVMIARVGSLLKKEGLQSDPEVQTLEDAACLVFLEEYLADFSAKHDEEKVLRILRKTWRKMTERGRNRALELSLEPTARALLKRVLEG